MKTVWRNNLSQVLDTITSEAATTDGWKDYPLMNEKEKGNAMARRSESEKRLDRGDIAAKKMGALGSGNASKSLKAKGEPRGLCVHACSNNHTKYETQIMSPFSYLSSSSKKVICVVLVPPPSRVIFI